VAAATVMASAKGTSMTKIKNKTHSDHSPTLDTVNFLTADESLILVSNDDLIKDQIAAGIYYKDIGSRKDLDRSGI
jgi:hypothetical protein